MVLDRIKLLLLCGHNSCRSQMAEGFMKKYGSERWDIVSAGVLSKPIHPLAIKVMNEVGIDISDHTSKRLEDIRIGSTFGIVISTCRHEEENCRTYLAPPERHRWEIDDPATAIGSEEDVLQEFRRIRDEIEVRVRDFCRGRSSGRHVAVN